MNDFGLPVVAERWPHGLMCADCNELLTDGQTVFLPRYSERLTGMGENPYGDPAIPGDMSAAMCVIVCVSCGLRETALRK